MDLGFMILARFAYSIILKLDLNIKFLMRLYLYATFEQISAIIGIGNAHENKFIQHVDIKCFDTFQFLCKFSTDFSQSRNIGVTQNKITFRFGFKNTRTLISATRQIFPNP